MIRKVLVLIIFMFGSQVLATERDSMGSSYSSIGTEIIAYSVGLAACDATIKLIEKQMADLIPVMEGPDIAEVDSLYQDLLTSRSYISTYLTWLNGYQSNCAWGLDQYDKATTEENKGWYAEYFWGNNYAASGIVDYLYTEGENFDFISNNIWDILDLYVSE